jgi:hypothetical protein
MRPIYRVLDVANHQAISDQVYKYICNDTDILNTRYPVVFTAVSIPHILQHVPLLKNFLEQRFLTPTLISIVVVTPNEPPYIHVDHIDPFVRILWPVMYCEGSKTKFYDIPKEFWKLNSPPQATTNPYYEITEERDWPILDEIELIEPIVFDASFAHAVHTNKNAPGNRISFTMGFDRNLPISKSVKAWFGFQR